MKIRTLFVILVMLILAGGAWAGDKAKTVSVTGEIACAKCTLKAADAAACQNVLVVEGKKDDDDTHYYMVKNDVTEAFGHVCQGTKAAKVTGTVEEKDGKMWLTASKMKDPAKKS